MNKFLFPYGWMSQHEGQNTQELFWWQGFHVPFGMWLLSAKGNISICPQYDCPPVTWAGDSSQQKSQRVGKMYTVLLQSALRCTLFLPQIVGSSGHRVYITSYAQCTFHHGIPISETHLGVTWNINNSEITKRVIRTTCHSCVQFNKYIFTPW